MSRPAFARLIAVLLACLALPCLPAAVRAAEIRQVYLVQNSGWMEPFLVDGKSPFRALLAALIEKTQLEGVPVTLASFNQDGQVAGQTSPRALYEGPYAAAPIATAIKGIDLPLKKGTRDKYPDADFNGALLGTIKSLLKGGEGVIWMITNNKNAPGNDPEVQKNTERFYAELRDSAAIPRIIAYPLRMPVKGAKFEAGGLLIYGIAYGETAARALDAIMAAGTPIHGLFEFPQVNLKPVQEAPVTLRFDDVRTEDGTRVRVEDGILVVTGANAGEGATVRLQGRLHNTFYPQRIVSAEIELAWTEIGAAESGLARAAVVPPLVQEVAPLSDSQPFTVELGIPPIPRPPGLGGLVANGRTVDGSLAIRLKSLRLDLDPAFLSRIEPIFAGTMMTGGQARTIDSQLPDIFFDYQRISETATTLPVRIEATYSPWPLIAAASAALLLLLAAGAAAVLATAGRSQKVMLGHYGKQVHLKPFRVETVRAPDGSQWRVRRGLVGPARATRLDGPAGT